MMFVYIFLILIFFINILSLCIVTAALNNLDVLFWREMLGIISLIRTIFSSDRKLCIQKKTN